MRWAAVALCVLSAVAVLVTAPAGAVPPDEAGWWWRVQSLPVPVPSPTQPGELMVGQAPDGQTAIAAVRFTLAEGETAPVLRLKAANEANPGGLKLLACPALTPWSPGEAQPFNARPAADCTRSQAVGARADDGTWTFTLTGFSEGNLYDVVIQPGEPEPGAVRQPASVTFAKPGPEAVTASAAPATDPGFTEQPVPAEEPLGGEDFSGDFGGEVALPGPVGDLAVPRPTEAPSIGATPGRLAGRPAAAPVGTVAPAVEDALTGRPGLAALILFIGAAIAATRLRDAPFSHAALFGHIGGGRRHVELTPEPGGLAQFVRPRVGKPNPLS